jgi:glycosyltransferase involved in cell wall biosynthesis
MKIDILTNADHEPHGSFTGFTYKTLWGDNHRIGLGGSEYALITMAEEWTKAGHEVVLYNNPWEVGASPFEQRSVGAFDPMANRDVLIVFRSPTIRAVPANGLKVWFSCDQATTGNFSEFARGVHKIVCISPFHAKFFADVYGITDTIVIDLPVRASDFDAVTIEKVPNRFIFTSVPARGIKNFHRMWARIKQRVRDATVVITSDYRLWGSGAGNEWARSMWMQHQDYEYMGAVPRQKYIEELLKAEILLYPCNYDELFCISVAEAQYAGVYPITSAIGALPTTNMGCVLPVNPDDANGDQVYIGEVVDILRDRERLNNAMLELKQKAKDRFSPETILREWDEKVFK